MRAGGRDAEHFVRIGQDRAKRANERRQEPSQLRENADRRASPSGRSGIERGGGRELAEHVRAIQVAALAEALRRRSGPELLLGCDQATRRFEERPRRVHFFESVGTKRIFDEKKERLDAPELARKIREDAEARR